MDIREILRRLREKHSDRQIAKDLNINRRQLHRRLYPRYPANVMDSISPSL
jgi:FixJ family two-component response regulator